jgi:hypothetical protein
MYEDSLRDFDKRVTAVTCQGAADTMIAYLDAHPETDGHAYADALVELVLNAIGTGRRGRRLANHHPWTDGRERPLRPFLGGTAASHSGNHHRTGG